jgi:hypothetical protein
VNDRQIIEYLRSRGRAEPPLELTRSVMAAIDEAPPARSWFSAYLPAFVAAGAVAVVAVLALLLGPGRGVGPAPTPSPTPAVSTPSPAGSVTLGALEAAVTAALDRLADSGGVQGTQTYSIEHYLASATWFDWRPGGEQVVITRTDIDASAPWWTDPDGEPLTVGERIDTQISVISGERFYRTERGAWVVASREDAPGALAWPTGVLSGAVPPLAGVETDADVVVSRHDLQDGGETWVLELAHDDGAAIVDWRMDAQGRLVSYAVQGVGVTVAPSVDLGRVSTRAVIEFTPVADPEPIPAPDPDSAPDPADFGLPADFPLDAPLAEGAPSGGPLAQDGPDCRHTSGAYSVTLPAGWWTNVAYDHEELGEIGACESFAPAEFDPTTASREQPRPDGIAIALDYLDGSCVGFINPILEERETTVDGHPARVLELAQGKEEDNPPGHYQYIVDLAPDLECEAGGRYIVGTTGTDMVGDYEENKAILDRMMETMVVTPP